MGVLGLFQLLRHRTQKRTARLIVVGAVAATGFGLWAAGAIAIFPDSNVAAYAGCLNTGGSSAGSFSQVAVGDAPAKPCGQNQMVVHLSGGDITAVRTASGSGLTGGTDNGAASLSLAGSFALPQSCSDQQIPKWNNTSGAWACANQNAYTNGTGLDLSSANVFSVSSGYQLPQGCSFGQVVRSGGNNTWTCQTGVSGVTAYTVVGSKGVGCCFLGDETAFAFCNFGDVVTGGGFNTDDVDIEGSGPSNNGFGWFAHATGGLEGGTVTVYVRCLHFDT
jgi:hypothetical protein